VLVDRLIIEGDEGVESVDLHPRLTVIGGMPPTARIAFAQLLAGALHGTERGVHAELTDDSAAGSWCCALAWARAASSTSTPAPT
jgi:hypothetical protein